MRFLTRSRVRLAALVALLVAVIVPVLPSMSPPDLLSQQGRTLVIIGQAPNLTSGVWSLLPASRLFAQGYSRTNPYSYWVPPGACFGVVSGNGTGTNGLTSVGASSTPAMNLQTDNTGTNTHHHKCNISPPGAIITSGNGIAITSATFMYGVQTTGLGTQVATLSSGTMNSQTVFTTITYPTAGASETPSTVTPVRADAGNLVITPAVASFNVATTTAGAFYSANFAPATPIVYKTTNVQLLLNVSLLNTATSATVTNTPGAMVFFRGQ